MLGPDLQRMPYELSTEAYESSFILKITHTKTSRKGKQRSPWANLRRDQRERLGIFFPSSNSRIKRIFRACQFQSPSIKQS